MPPSISELQQTLEPAVGRILHIHRKPSPFASRGPIEELEVVRANASTLRMIFKDLTSEARFENPRPKPEFLCDPLREIETYRTILRPLDLGTAKFFASVGQPARYWLFLEHVDGVHLWQLEDPEVWRGAARWLAQLHSQRVAQTGEPHLLRYDLAYYERCWQGAMTNEPALSAIRPAYQRATEHLLCQPPAFIHGEFYPSNVLIDGSRVCPIDWEGAALGPALIDLAALTVGKSRDEECMALMAAYAGETELVSEIRYTLNCCRLHLAVRLLASARAWQPPGMHARNWHREALQIAELLA